jgi:alpha-methylacyl-CoA racemase
MAPLTGVRVVELPAIGPVPFAGMVLADLGAEVIRITRPESADLGVALDPRFELMHRGRPAVAIDLKHPDGTACALGLIERGDALIEGFRPGVMERLGLGPDVCHARNPRLVYGRMTGWGQSGPLAREAGHDINYLALSGVLHAIGPADSRPVPPLNLVGDFGGGAMMLVVGMLAAVIEAKRTGRGRVVDAAIAEGAAYLATIIHGLLAAGIWRDCRGENILDGGAPYYGTYETSDAKYVAVGAIEARFYAALLAGLGLTDTDLPKQDDRRRWPELRARLAAAFKMKSRDAWAAHFAGSDACVTPVLSLTEAAHHPHARARQAFVEPDGIVRPTPSPRMGGAAVAPMFTDGPSALTAWGVGRDEVARYVASGAVK